ncbi:hypothetical protein PSTT_13422 [Puccinia striiformis]|uniref:Secreted protein n=1 Tax=Puccinia striiformis TaxID=27350 RepID=A0A2S4US98_9BASI|nr:hypothetical protein PSTT_17142 [Puccinia striiformis]POV99984.1 hypothetical protein PSTT_13422 [Puccinia striiformis]
MYFSSFSMILILGLIHCGATYARFPCNNPAYPGPHQGTCSRPVKLSDFARGVPPQKKERIMKSMTIVAPAKPSKGQFTCDQGKHDSYLNVILGMLCYDA